jgi:hypothetical protein
VKDWPNDRWVTVTLSACMLIITVSLCVGLYFDKPDNTKIYPLLGAFLNLALVGYLGLIKKKDDEPAAKLLEERLKELEARLSR